MNDGYLKKIALACVAFSLAVLTFFERLGNAPKLFFRIGIRVVVYGAVIIPLLVILQAEITSSTATKVLRYVLVPSNRIVSIAPLNLGPVQVRKIPVPEISAKSALVADLNTGTILFADNEYDVLPPASTTKLVTAVVALETFDLNEIVLIPEVCTEIIAQKAGFVAYEPILVKDLIYSILINSAGDSACALAHADTTYGAFIGKMNKKVYEWGATQTTFANPIGLDDAVNQQYSSAYDLFLISQRSLQNELITEIVQTKEYDLETGLIPRRIFNTNNLLWEIDGSVGIKTGRTYGAGEVLTYRYKKDNADLFIVVMGSEDRFSDTKLLLDWTLNSYKL